MQKERILNEILPRVTNPAQYLGTEKNAITKDPRAVRLSVALAFPDTYEIGMSHLGLPILYDIANRDDRFAAERVFAPLPDFADVLARAGLTLPTLESGRPVRDFDVLGFSIQHELSYTTLLWMLDLSGIPLRSADRRPGDPIVIAGGPCAFSPEPLADFVDIFFLGDGEESFPEFLSLCADLRRAGASRADVIRESALSIPGLYAPALYAPRYDPDGTLRAVEPLDPRAPFPVRARVVEDLESAPCPTAPVVPLARTVHDRIMIEIMRGCARGCRFCQAGATKRPVRRRSPDLILRLAEETYANTGHNEIALTSLSSSDYPDIVGLARLLSERFRSRRVNLSLPSLRVGKELSELPAVLADVRRGGFTVAPEAASDRLRRIINKRVSESDLEKGVLEAYEAGWKVVKLYFMIGLPGEADEEVERIVDLAAHLSDLRRSMGSGPAQINATISIFVPKALTPFQWAPMISVEEASRKRDALRRRRLRGSVRLKFHDARQSFLEGVFARGDRRLGELLLRAYAAGAKLEAWTERFDFDLWTRVFREAPFDAVAHVTRERAAEETLPWDHLSAGVPREKLRDEYDKAMAER
ncbi:MAG: TIGR03960 family B12-binding radical SAM protein [Planctomycetota bacterium]